MLNLLAAQAMLRTGNVTDAGERDGHAASAASGHGDCADLRSCFWAVAAVVSLLIVLSLLCCRCCAVAAECAVAAVLSLLCCRC
jgi:hypothetical protein